MLIPKLDMRIDIVGKIIDTTDGYLIGSSTLLKRLCDTTGYDLDSIYLVLDVDIAPISIACLFDLGDEEEHYLFYDVELSEKDLKYLEAKRFI